MNRTDQQDLQNGLYALSAVLNRVYGTGIPDFLRSGQGLLAPFDKFDVDFSIVGTAQPYGGGSVVVAGVTYQYAYFPNAGDFFGVDDSPTFTSLTGIESYVTFNQQNNDQTKAPLFLSPGKTFTTPFKGFTLYYVQTAAKKARIIYSTGSRFVLTSQAISSILAAVKVSDTNGNSIDTIPATGLPVLANRELLTVEGGAGYGVSFKSSAALVASTSEQVVAPGTNVNGIEIISDGALSTNASTIAAIALQAHTSAPNGFAVGDILALSSAGNAITGSVGSFLELKSRLRVASGKGIYHTDGFTEVTGIRYTNYVVF